MKKIMIVSTLVAFCGGAGTMMAASSCDPACLQDGRTSVFLQLEASEGSDWDPTRHHTEVKYIVHPPDEEMGFDDMPGFGPEERPGRCASMNCDGYALGFDEPGDYEITVEVCGKAFTTSVEVPLDDGLCHVEPQSVSLEVDDSACSATAIPRQMDPQDDGTVDVRECDLVAHPSVYVVVANTQGDVMHPVDVDRVWYTVTARGEEPGEPGKGVKDSDADAHSDIDRFRRPDGPGDPVPIDDLADPERPSHPDDQGDDGERELPPGEALCVADYDGTGCRSWVAGFETEGLFTISTEYCGVEVHETVYVEKPAMACHVDTQFVVLEVETMGCLQTPTQSPDTPTETEVFG